MIKILFIFLVLLFSNINSQSNSVVEKSSDAVFDEFFSFDEELHINCIMLEDYWVYGQVLYNFEPLDSIKVMLEDLAPGGDTLEYITDVFYVFDGIESSTYTIRPVSNIYTFDPPSRTIFIGQNNRFDFFAYPISSVLRNNLIEIKQGILYCKDITGLEYKIITLNGIIIESGILPKELNLYQLTNGTYILNITKGDKVVYTYKYQVVR